MIGLIARISAAANPLLITAQDQTLTSFSPGSVQDAECGIRYESDGDTFHVRHSGAGDIQLEDWILGGGTPSNWYVRATRTGGSAVTLDVGNLNTWEQLNANRSYVITDATNNDVAYTMTLTIEFSDDGGSTVYTSVDVSLSANTSSS